MIASFVSRRFTTSFEGCADRAETASPVTLTALNQFLLLYSWFLLAVLIWIMLLIARFYQQFSGDQTYFRLYFVPLVLFGVAAVRYASINQMYGDWFGDLAYGSAGLVLIILSLRLYRQMTAGRK